MPQDKPREKTELQAQGFLSFLCEPGAIEIEAADGGAGDGKPKLPRFSMVAYTGGPMRIAGWLRPRTGPAGTAPWRC